jgi:serine/threonine-protein kinase
MVWAKGHPLQDGKYIIEEVLGQGGFGITYKALHKRLNAFVVIKTPNEYLKYDPDYDQYVDRFIKEGQRLAQLSQDPHPHIVRVWDLFEEGEIPCMVMDFVPGENLFQLVRRRGALPEAEIVPCIRQIGEALAVIHRVGLVHRDAHPGNIIVRPDSRAILIDFGIAKELVPSTQSSTGVAGNQGFAPYEQMSRGSREPTVDVYCLAATLYFAVTGQRPVTSLDRRLHGAVLIAPKQVKRDLSDFLNQAILKGMALEPEARPQTMRSWLDLLQEPSVQPSQSAENEIYRRPVETQQKTPVITNQKPPARRRSNTIPWISLAFVLAGYAAIGTSFVVSSAPLRALPLALALALVGAGAETWALALALALTVVLALAGSLAVVGGLVGVGVGALAKGELLESFSRSHIFMILAGTSLVGLGLGWLIGTVWRSSGFVFPTFGML